MNSLNKNDERAKLDESRLHCAPIGQHIFLKKLPKMFVNFLG